jgi:hypothetical protein
VRFDPNEHTRGRLLSQVDELLQASGDRILIGSLGRAAAIGSEAEFALKRETIERKRGGWARDIDIIVRGRDVVESCSPFPVDTTAITAHDQRLVFENGHCWLVDDLLNLAVEVSADAFQPYSTKLFGEVTVTTFSPSTHYALLFVIYEGHHRYGLVRRWMAQQSGVEMTGVHAELYQPFFEFYRARQRNLMNHARCLYRNVVPQRVRYLAHPTLSRLRSLFQRGMERPTVIA